MRIFTVLLSVSTLKKTSENCMSAIYVGDVLLANSEPLRLRKTPPGIPEEHQETLDKRKEKR